MPVYDEKPTLTLVQTRMHEIASDLGHLPARIEIGKKQLDALLSGLAFGPRLAEEIRAGEATLLGMQVALSPRCDETGKWGLFGEDEPIGREL